MSGGPLVFPSVMFGDELKVRPAQAYSLGFDLKAVAGVAQVDLIMAGAVLKSESFAAAPLEVHVDFPLSTRRSTWYALIVKDARGRKAYTDPIWVDATVPLPDPRPAQGLQSRNGRIGAAVGRQFVQRRSQVLRRRVSAVIVVLQQILAEVIS